MRQTNELRIKNLRLSSDLLAKEVDYCAILPENYENYDGEFPVLYLLHGLFGRFDNWLTETRIVEYAKDFPGVIICADGGDNWYSDALNLKEHFYESFFFDELFPAAERDYKIGKSERRGRLPDFRWAVTARSNSRCGDRQCSVSPRQ